MRLVMVASDNYIPSESEEYMCEKHLEYFRDKLQNWKEENKTSDNVSSFAPYDSTDNRQGGISRINFCEESRDFR